MVKFKFPLFSCVAQRLLLQSLLPTLAVAALMKVFVIPASHEQLLNSSSEDVVCVEHPSALAELSPDAVQEFADGQSATCRSSTSTVSFAAIEQSCLLQA